MDDYIAARRYDEAEAEYRRSLTLEGEPCPADAGRLRAHAGSQGCRPQGATRTASPTGARLRQTAVPPYFRDLGAVLHDRDAMLAILRNAAADSAYRGDGELWLLADALGEADLAAAAMRESMEGRKGFKEGQMAYGNYWTLWMAPYSGLRGPSRIQEAADRNGTGRVLAANRQVGRWLQARGRRRFPVPVTGASAVSAARLVGVLAARTAACEAKTSGQRVRCTCRGGTSPMKWGARRTADVREGLQRVEIPR